jgi:hypothetical protein
MVPKTDQTDHKYFSKKTNYVAKSNRMCCVPFCTKRYGDEGISLFSFPKKNKQPKRHNLWIHKLRMGKAISKNSVVCTVHFTENDLIPATSKYLVINIDNTFLT